MQSLVFTNSAGQTVTIAYTRPYFLQGLLGMSDIPADYFYSKGYAQDGQTAAGQYLQPRPVAFNVRILANSLLETFTYRRALIAFFNPKDTFTAIYTNDYFTKKIYCRASAPLFISTQDSGKIQSATISLTCDDPYLYDLTETELRLSQEQPAFMFPLFFPPAGMYFGSLANQVIINNTGDVETPVRIQFVGGIESPVITNETTGESIVVNQTIAATDILEITTGYGNKKVTIIAADGTRTSAFQYIDSDLTTFFNLALGENILTYTATSGADTAAAYIYYSQRYLGA